MQPERAGEGRVVGRVGLGVAQITCFGRWRVSRGSRCFALWRSTTVSPCAAVAVRTNAGSRLVNIDRIPEFVRGGDGLGVAQVTFLQCRHVIRRFAHRSGRRTIY